MRIRLMTATTFAMLLAGAAGAQDTDPARFAPREALMFMGVADLRVAIDKYAQTSSMKMLQDPAVDAMAQGEPVSQVLDQLRDRVAQLLETTPEKLENPFGGPAAFYLNMESFAPNAEPDLGLVLSVHDSAEHREQAREYYDKIISRLRDRASRTETEELGSDRLYVFTFAPGTTLLDRPSAGDEQERSSPMETPSLGGAAGDAVDNMLFTEPLPTNLAVALTDRRLYVGGDRPTIEAMDRRVRSGGGLAEHDEYRMLERRFRPLGQLRLFINVPRVVELAQAEAPDAAQMIKALGLESFGPLIGHQRVDVGSRRESTGEGMLLLRSPRRGIAKILTMSNTEVSVPADTPENVFMLSTMQLSLRDTFEEVQRIVRAFDPATAEQMDRTLSEVPMPDGSKIDLREELINNLQPPIVFDLALSKPYGPQSAQLLLRIGQRDRDALKRLISAFPMFVPRDVRGATVYDMMGFSLAVTAREVLAGTQNRVEAALQAERAGTGLSSTAAFRATTRELGGPAQVFMYINPRPLMEATVALAGRAPQSLGTTPGGMILAELIKEMGGPVQEKDTEAYRRLLRYMAPSAVIFQDTPEGILFRSVQMAPDVYEQ